MEKDTWKEILSILKQQFPDKDFVVGRGDVKDLWCLYCNDYFFYNSEEFKITLEFIRDSFKLKFYSCVMHNITMKMFSENEECVVS